MDVNYTFLSAIMSQYTHITNCYVVHLKLIQCYVSIISQFFIKSYVVYKSIYMTFHNNQNYGNRKLVSGCQGLGVEGGIDYNKDKGIFFL